MLVSSNVPRSSAVSLFENISVTYGGNRWPDRGANGSGKSTFMKIPGGDLEPTLGNVSSIRMSASVSCVRTSLAFETFTAIDTVIMGHGELWEVKQSARPYLRALPEMSEEDGYKVADSEVKYGEMDGYSAEACGRTVKLRASRWSSITV